MKQLRINATLPLPDDTLEQAELMVKLRPAINALSEALGVPVEANVVRPGTRTPKAPVAEMQPLPLHQHKAA